VGRHASSLREHGGAYLADCQLAESTPEATDPDTAPRLWELSERWVSTALNATGPTRSTARASSVPMTRRCNAISNAATWRGGEEEFSSGESKGAAPPEKSAPEQNVSRAPVSTLTRTSSSASQSR
jgi:hypothetical protein